MVCLITADCTTTDVCSTTTANTCVAVGSSDATCAAIDAATPKWSSSNTCVAAAANSPTCASATFTCQGTSVATPNANCGINTITTCSTTIGGGDGSTSVHTFAQVNGVCPTIDLCTYCDDKNAGNLYLEYVEANGCPTVPSEPAGGADIVTKKNIMLQPSDGCRTASRRTVQSRTVNVVKTVDVDAMVLLDVSGSVSNPDWDNQLFLVLIIHVQ